MKSIVFECQTPGAPGQMSFTADSAAGLIRVEVSGFWPTTQTSEILACFTQLVAAIHLQGKRAIIITDLRKAATQSQEVTSLLQHRTADIFRPGDRVAMMIENSLLRLQMRRTLRPEHHEFFASISAAERWALASSCSAPETL